METTTASLVQTEKSAPLLEPLRATIADAVLRQISLEQVARDAPQASSPLKKASAPPVPSTSTLEHLRHAHAIHAGQDQK